MILCEPNFWKLIVMEAPNSNRRRVQPDDDDDDDDDDDCNIQTLK